MKREWYITMLYRTNKNVIIILASEYDRIARETPVFRKMARDWNRKASGRW